MPVGKIKTISENAGFRRFVGVGLFTVEGVNMTKEQLSALYGREVEKDPVYLSSVEVNGQMVQRAHIVFHVSTEYKGEKEFFNVRYTLTNAPQIGTQSGKWHVMDRYGRTAWVTEAELQQHAIPEKQRVANNYWPLHGRGEEGFIKFLRELLGVDNVDKWAEVDGKRQIVGMIDNPADAELYLEDASKLFKGDFSEVRELVAMTSNKIKLLAGVRTDDQNKTWQDFFVEFPMRANVQNYSRLEKVLKEAQDAGQYANTHFEICDFKLYEEAPTSFAAAEKPAEAPTANPWFS